MLESYRANFEPKKGALTSRNIVQALLTRIELQEKHLKEKKPTPFPPIQKPLDAFQSVDQRGSAGRESGVIGERLDE